MTAEGIDMARLDLIQGNSCSRHRPRFQSIFLAVWLDAYGLAPVGNIQRQRPFSTASADDQAGLSYPVLLLSFNWSLCEDQFF
jgi:hypothetical protein